MCELECRPSRQKKNNLALQVLCGRKGCNMGQSCDIRNHRLLQMSADLQNRMAELWALREAVRTAELREPEPIHPAVVAPPLSNELRV